MTTPDVRVRLSAEGVAEVVGALKKIQDESAKASAKQAGAFKGLNGVLGNTQRLLAGVGVALSVRSFANFIRGSSDAAEEMGNLAMEVGATTEHLSALAYGASQTGIGMAELSRGLVIFNRRRAELVEGNPAAIQTFRDLGIEIEDLQGKDAAESLELVARRLAAMPAGATKTRAALDLLGRSGARLIPMLDELGTKGLAALVTRARELNLVIDDEMVASAQKLGDTYDQLKLQFRNLAIEFAAGFGPQFENLGDYLSGGVGESAKTWRRWGENVGRFVNAATVAIEGFVDAVKTGFQGAWIVVSGFFRGVAKGPFKTGEADQIMKSALEEANKLDAAYRERELKRDELLKRKPEEAAAPSPTKAPDEPPDPAELVRRRAAAARAVLDTELQMVRTQAKLRNDAEKRGLEQGLTDIHEYYRRRQEIAAAAANQEVVLLLKKRALLSAEPDAEKAASEQAQIDAEIAKIRLEQQNDVATMQLEETRAVRELAKERLGIEQQILEAQGRTHAAAMLAIQQEIDAKREALQSKGGLDESAEAALQTLRRTLESRADFDEAVRQAEAGLAELAAARAEIQGRADAGLISQFEAEQQILALEQGRLATLGQLADALLAAAKAAGNPEAIAQAQEFADAIRDIGVSARGATDFLSQLKSTAIDSSESALADFFDKGLQSAKNWEAGVRGAIASVAADLRRLASQALAAQTMKAILGAFSGGGKVEIAKKADGGLLGGRGTGTSDSNLALVSRGEYIVRAAAVAQPGVLRYLEAINRNGARPLMYTPELMSPPVPRFAGGGLVAADASASGGAEPFQGTLTVELSEGLIGRYLESPAGQRMQIKTAARNRRAYNAALGR